MTSNYNWFISRENLFEQTKFPEDIRELTHAQIGKVIQHIEAGMSPENLHKDGEATKEEVSETIAYYRMLCLEISKNTEYNIDFNSLNY